MPGLFVPGDAVMPDAAATAAESAASSPPRAASGTKAINVTGFDRTVR